MKFRREFIWKLLALLFLSTVITSCAEDDEIYSQTTETADSVNETEDSDPPDKDDGQHKYGNNETK
mgnify:CR=1 FL=1